MNRARPKVPQPESVHFELTHALPVMFVWQVTVAAVLFVGLLLLGSPLCEASPADRSGGSKSLTRAISAYNSALKSDPRVTDLIRWEGAAADLIEFVESNSKSTLVPKALLTLGNLYETIYRKRQFGAGLSRAVYYYEQVAREFQGNTLADDALLALGDLRREILKDETGARIAYTEIVERYRKGDRFGAARERLKLAQLDTKQLGHLKPVPVRDDNEVSSSQVGQGVTGQASATPDPIPTTGTLASIGIDSNEPRFEEDQPPAADLLARSPLVVIDPGHGGEDLGAVGVGNILEKDVVLNIALILDELLRDRLRARTFLTRARDVSVPLETRTQIANDKKADLFISIHANASELRNASGVESYYLDNTDDKASLKLAERENRSVLQDGTLGDLSLIISDLIQNAKLDDSIALAHHAHNGMVRTVSRYYEGLKDLGVKKAPFYVLVGAHMPCVLVEVSFIDHPLDGARLAEQRYQRLLASGLYRGVREYFEKKRS